MPVRVRQMTRTWKQVRTLVEATYGSIEETAFFRPAGQHEVFYAERRGRMLFHYRVRENGHIAKQTRNSEELPDFHPRDTIEVLVPEDLGITRPLKFT